MKNSKIILITLLVSLAILRLSSVQAQSSSPAPQGYPLLAPLPGYAQYNPSSAQSFSDYITALYRLFLGAAVVAAFLGLIIGGVEYMVSSGSTSRQEDAKDRIRTAVLGLLLVLGAVFILNQISGSITSFSIVLPQLPTIESLSYLNVSENAGWNQAPPNTACSLSNLSPYSNLISQAANQYGIDPSRLQAVMLAESSGNANAVSVSAAYGLMQVTVNTARHLDSSLSGLSDSQVAQKLKDPAYNIQLGSLLYSQLLSVYSSSDLASAAYNGGTVANQASVDCPGLLKWQCPWDDPAHTIPNTGFQETRNYVNVIDNFQSQIQNGSCS